MKRRPLRTYELQLTAQGDYCVNGKVVPATEPETAIRKARHGGRRSFWQEQFQQNIAHLRAHFSYDGGPHRRVTFLELHADGLPVYVRADRVLAVRPLYDEERQLCPTRNTLVLLFGERDYFVDELAPQIIHVLGEAGTVPAATE